MRRLLSVLAAGTALALAGPAAAEHWYPRGYHGYHGYRHHHHVPRPWIPVPVVPHVYVPPPQPGYNPYRGYQHCRTVLSGHDSYGRPVFIERCY